MILTLTSQELTDAVLKLAPDPVTAVPTQQKNNLRNQTTIMRMKNSKKLEKEFKNKLKANG